MIKKVLAVNIALLLAVSLAGAADTASTRENLSAAEIANRSVAARGGLQAWRAVQTISMEGKMGAGGNQRAPLPVPVPGKQSAKLQVPSRPAEEVQLPFAIKLERPRKMRLEVEFNGQTSIQVFDGANGWKFRPFLNRRDIEPYTPDEMKAASMKPDLDGPLVDYAAKGTRVELDGIEEVEDRDTYRLKLTLKDGNSIHLWIDSKTFLETKIEGQPRRLDRKMHPVEIYYRDYRPVGGLQIPFLLETRVLPIADPTERSRETPVPAEKIVIEKVEVNPKLDASLFSKPQIQPASNHRP
jgi:outer membrane lipoprotein-sorting protein